MRPTRLARLILHDLIRRHTQHLLLVPRIRVVQHLHLIMQKRERVLLVPRMHTHHPDLRKDLTVSLRPGQIHRVRLPHAHLHLVVDLVRVVLVDRVEVASVVEVVVENLAAVLEEVMAVAEIMP